MVRRGVRAIVPLALLAVALGSTVRVTPAVSAATPASGSVSAASPNYAWKFAPVFGQAADGRTIAENCSVFPAQCDNFDLTVNPTPSVAGQQAVLTITYTWKTSTGAPEDLDVFDVNAAGTSGPGNPDDIQDPGKEILTIVNPVAGVHHIRSVAAVTFEPTAADTTAVLSFRAAPGTGGGATFVTTPVAYGPAAIVSAHFTSGEPQTTWEHTPPAVTPLAGAINPNRIFVDEPLSSRSMTGQLHRSLDGGKSFRPILDPACLSRNRPNCATGGGGDTANKVNLYDGTVFFGDQEAVVQEAIASSTDHADTFPLGRQFAVTSASTGDDRQWLAPVNAPNRKGGPTKPDEVRAFYSYHIPAVGEIIQGIGLDGQPILLPQAPQLLDVSQSGISRVDTTGGPGDGYVYQSYRDGKGFEVGVSPISKYQNPWKFGHVSDMQPTIFPWISLDTHGNLYAVWVTDGQVFLSYSLIDDPKNNPKATPTPGVPATQWSKAVQINLPRLNSTVFPEVVAGDPGRIAVAYMGTSDRKSPGRSDDVPTTAKWNVYTALITDALSATPTVATGQVNHRINHLGTICTSGTTCMGDRSLLDLIDLDISNDGRVGVVFTDNQSSFGNETGSASAKGEPFIHYATEVQGPSLYTGRPSISIPVPATNFRDAPAGDATWPNVAGAPNLPSLDERRAEIATEGGDVVAKIQLGDTRPEQMSKDLATYSAASPAQPGQRLQYVMRFSTGADIYHLSAEFTPGTPNLRFFGGKVDKDDALTNGTPTSFLGAAYHTDASFKVTGSVDAATNTITIRGRQSDFGVAVGTPLYSVTGFAMAGPQESLEQTVLYLNRTIDATPPFDTVLAVSTSSGSLSGGGKIPVPNTGAVEGESAAVGLLALAGAALVATTSYRRRRRARHMFSQAE